MVRVHERCGMKGLRRRCRWIITSLRFLLQLWWLVSNFLSKRRLLDCPLWMFTFNLPFSAFWHKDVSGLPWCKNQHFISVLNHFSPFFTISPSIQLWQEVISSNCVDIQLSYFHIDKREALCEVSSRWYKDQVDRWNSWRIQPRTWIFRRWG